MFVLRSECICEKRTHEPPHKDEHRPLEQVLVLRYPKPYPREIRKTVAHRHPEKNPEQAVPVRNASGMAHKMENTVVHRHI